MEPSRIDPLELIVKHVGGKKSFVIPNPFAIKKMYQMLTNYRKISIMGSIVHNTL